MLKGLSKVVEGRRTAGRSASGACARRGRLVAGGAAGSAGAPPSSSNTKPDINRLFTLPLICSAALLSFAHGANDVANAVGPLAAIAEVVRSGAVIRQGADPDLGDGGRRCRHRHRPVAVRPQADPQGGQRDHRAGPDARLLYRDGSSLDRCAVGLGALSRKRGFATFLDHLGGRAGRSAALGVLMRSRAHSRAFSAVRRRRCRSGWPR